VSFVITENTMNQCPFCPHFLFPRPTDPSALEGEKVIDMSSGSIGSPSPSWSAAKAIVTVRSGMTLAI